MIEVDDIIGKPEDEHLEYKAVLPPAQNIAQLIAGFANLDGGIIVLGVVENAGGIQINGLSEDFRVSAVMHKALDSLSPTPDVIYQHVNFKGKNLYVIKIAKSAITISVQGKTFIRDGTKTKLKDSQVRKINSNSIGSVKVMLSLIDDHRKITSGSKSRLLDQYVSITNIIDDLGKILYPINADLSTNIPEGKVLMRMLFSSCADNFETYLSELLYEIYLAKPETLKGDNQQVSIKEVLNCSDMSEFLIYWSKKKLSKLERGSVKGFLVDNQQISSLGALSENEIETIEDIFQIRHLYVHKNGIIDEKFLTKFPGSFTLNDQHQLSTNQMLSHIDTLLKAANKIDLAALDKFMLATF